MNAVADVVARRVATTARSKNILLVTNIFPPQIGGPATFVDRLAQELAHRGHRVTVVCSSDAQSDASDTGRNFRVRRVSLARRELYEIKIRLILFWEMLRHRVVLVNGLETYVAQVASILGRDYTLKVVGDTAWETARNRGTTSLDVDRFQTDAQAQQRHRDLVERRNKCVRRAARVFTPSYYLRDMVVGWGIPAARVVTIPNGIEPPAQAAGRAREAPHGDLRVLFVGRLTNWKGVETLLLALAGMAGVRATIVGDGPEFPHLAELARQLGVQQRAEFLGRRDPADVRRLMAGADALVLTSLYEGFSHTLLEACAVGCPCIASNVAGNAELITAGTDGLLIPPQDVNALRRALTCLKEDAVLRGRLAEGARRLAQGYAMGNTVERVIALITGAVGEPLMADST